MLIPNIPDNINAFLDSFVQAIQQQLTETLIGIYLHGSLALGCFNPETSDIDLLIVLRDKLTQDEKKALARLLLQISSKASRPLELSAITLHSLQNFHHPSAYELHFSDSNKADYANATFDFTCEKTDPDLAAHFVITKARGICLYGEPIDNIFPNVPDPVYLDSIMKDSDWSYANVMQGPDNGECQVPVYAVLNFCRVLAFIQEHLVTSKLEGGEWGLHNLPEQYFPVIQEALTEYIGNGSIHPVEVQLIKQFARYAYDRIHSFEN